MEAPSLPGEEEDDIQQHLEREGREARILFSWRVPNEPAHEGPSRTGGAEGGCLSTRGRGLHHTSLPLCSEASPPPTKSKHNARRPQGLGVSKVPGSALKDESHFPSSLQSPTGKDEKNRIRKTFWSYLFRNVNRAVDELYYLCEAEASTEHCEEAAKLLDSCSRDFYKLIERIEVQAKFEEDQKRCGDDDDASNQHRAPRGLGWEVRKTTGSTAPEQSVIIRQAIERMSGVQASQRHASIDDIPSAHDKRTEYMQQGHEIAGEGKATSRRKDERDQLGRGRRRSSRAQRPCKSEGTETLGDHRHEPHTADDDDADILSMMGSPKKLTFDDEAHNDHAGVEERAGGVPQLDVDAEEAHEAVMNEGPETTDAADVLDQTRLPIHDENEEATDIEVAEATEEVWAEAEAWVDAEAKAEDEAWARLQQHGDKLVVVVDESNSDEVDVILEDSFDGSRQPSGTDDASFFFENDHDADAEGPWLLSGAEGDLPVGDSPKSSFSSPLCSPRSSGHAQAGAGCATALDFALSRRYLRDKLSSPERKKPTPAEAKRKLDEKQFMADMKRVLMELERQKKLKLAAERMRGVSERRTRKTALAEKLYEAKLGQAEQRQKAHIQAIARKAEDESTKVKEISFINHLTSEVLRTTITERLTDVENRIQAGRARRQEHLHGIANRQKKKREKARQMSERRLEMEQLAAKRWDALQARLEAVQERRHQRLVEIQRRLESNSESRQQRQLRRDRDPSLREKENVPDTNRSSSDQRNIQHGGNGDPTWSSQAKPSRHSHRKAGKKKASASGPPKAGKQQEKADESLDVGAAVDTSATQLTAKPLLRLPATAQKIREHLCRGVPGWKPPGQEQRQQQYTESQIRKLKSILDELRADMGELSTQFPDGIAPGETDTPDDMVYESGDEDGRRTERPPGGLSSQGAVAKKRRRRRSKRATPPAVEPTAMLPPGPILQALKALAQVVETKNQALLSELGPLGALRLLCRLATPGAYPPSVTCQALHVLHICLQSADVRNGVLADCGGASMVDAALWSACHLQATEAKDLQATTSYSAALSSLCMLIRHVPSDEALRRLHKDLVGYATEAGVVQYASQVLDMVRGTLSGEEKDRARRDECMKITGKTLLLLEALSAAALAVSPSADHGHQDATAALRAKVMAAFKQTQLASQLPTLSALLMNERPHGGYDVEDVTEGVLSAAWLVLRCLNDLARIDLRTMQSLLRSEELHSYFHYVYSMLLRVLTAKLSKGNSRMASLKDVEASLEQLLTLIGFYFLDCPQTQQTLQASPVLLSRLANLPFRYFCDEQYKEVLFPTLLTACYPCCANKALLKNEMNTELLVAYLERKIEEREASLASGKEKGQSASGWAALSVRFPERFWQDAARYFQES